jgi:flagellar FliL protein
MAEKDNDDEAVEAGKSKKKLIIIIAAVVLLLLVNVVAMVLIVGSMKPEEEEKKEDTPVVEVLPKPNFIEITPAFIVNFEDQSLARFLQISVQLMTRDPAQVAAIQLHLPRIRNNLVLLFSSQDYQSMSSQEGKIQLRKRALEEVQSILREQLGAPTVEEIYFTNFVMQ